MTEPARSCHCHGLSRARMLRRAAAEAGRGLPSIETGMPLPAGTGLDRRAFLLRSTGLFLSIYGASKLGFRAFEEGIANAASNPPGRILVSIFLEGGADSMSILYPSGDAQYQVLRPTLALPESAGAPFSEDDRLRWHPAAAPLATLHQEGKVTTLPAIGYTDPDQSHFTSRHYWEVGATSASLRTGWIGRYLDRVGTPDNPLQGLSLDWDLQPSLASGSVPIATVESPDGYDFWARQVWGEVEEVMLPTIGRLGKAQTSQDAALRQAAKVAVQTDTLRQQLGGFDGFTSPVTYPTSDESFPHRLAALAAMIQAGLPLECVALQAPGAYDTHDDQANQLQAGLSITAASLLAFQRDLEARGLADRVVTLIWSEFGRRAEENGAGTDHGAAGLALVIGSPVRGQMVGEFPGLATGLDSEGNLKATSDFRGLYCSLLEQWLGTDAEGIIPNAAGFARPAVIA
ncbi:MAG TPA: DUF1501 domain-containing protein [Gaiellaceae bacterium]|jgi:uncharacterized protein (DUF1501 family)